MAGVPFNFPDSPAQDEEVTAVGGIVYVWDGVKWVSGAAPMVYLPLAGGTMVGVLLLARDPILPMEAATMGWVQNLVANHSGIPAGATTQVQFNNSGAFGASSNFTFDSTIPGVSIGGYPFTHRTLNVIGPAGIATGGEPGPGGITWIQDNGANAGLLIGVANPATPQENAWLQAYGAALDEVAPLVLQPAGLSNVGVGKFPDYPLDVAGDVNLSAGHVYRINGVPINSMMQTPWLQDINGSNYRLGNVLTLGIGKAAAAAGYLLDIQGQATSGPLVRLTCTGTNVSEAVKIIGPSSVTASLNLFVTDAAIATLLPITTYVQSRAADLVLLATNPSPPSILFFTATAGAPQERMRIGGSDGNVGIGTDNPAFRLVVNGDLNLIGSANFRIGGFPVAPWFYGAGSTISYSASYVGVGKAVPTCQLDVDGVVRIGGDSSLGGWPTSGSGIELGYVPGMAGIIQCWVRSTNSPDALHIKGWPICLNPDGFLTSVSIGTPTGHASRVYISTNEFNPGVNLSCAIRTEGAFGGGYLMTDTGESSGMWGFFSSMQIGFPKWGPLGQIEINAGVGDVRVRTRLNVGANASANDTGDIAVSRDSNPAAGVLFLGNANRYLYFTGSQYEMPGGDLILNGVHVPSDVRIKDNIRPVSDDPLALLARLNFVEYENNGLGGSIRGRKGIGLVAQEVQEVLPEAVGSMHLLEAPDDEILTINYQSLYIHALRAIVELKNRIEQLEKANNDTDSRS